MAWPGRGRSSAAGRRQVEEGAERLNWGKNEREGGNFFFELRKRERTGEEGGRGFVVRGGRRRPCLAGGRTGAGERRLTA